MHCPTHEHDEQKSTVICPNQADAVRQHSKMNRIGSLPKNIVKLDSSHIKVEEGLISDYLLEVFKRNKDFFKLHFFLSIWYVMTINMSTIK